MRKKGKKRFFQKDDKRKKMVVALSQHVSAHQIDDLQIKAPCFPRNC